MIKVIYLKLYLQKVKMKNTLFAMNIMIMAIVYQ